MLLGDRSFLEQTEAADFQKTGVFQRTGCGRFARRGSRVRSLLGGTEAAVVTSVDDAIHSHYAFRLCGRCRAARARAAGNDDAAVVALGGFFFRRLELLNSAAVAALILLVARPLALRDSSFQLTFVAIGCISGLALPWLEKTVQPYVRALRGWRDVTRDAAHEPRAAQFRIDLRSLTQWLSSRLPQRLGKPTAERFCWRIISDVSCLGAAGSHAGTSDGNVAADGARFSSHHIVGARL